jgi:hypothetical protein
MAGGIGWSVKAGGWVMRVTRALTRLSPWGQTGTIRSSWRSRAVAFRGFQAWIGRRHRIAPQAFIARWERHVAFATHEHLWPTIPHETYSRRQVVPCGATSNRLRPHVWEQVGSSEKSGFDGVSCSAKWGVSPPRPTSCQAPRAKRRSMIAQTTRRGAEGVIDGREHRASQDWPS